MQPGPITPPGKRAAVVGQPRLAGDERAVFLRAELHAHERAGRRAGPLEDLVALHRHLHRPAALAAEQRGDRLEVDGDLAAEAAADLARHDDAPARRGSAAARPPAGGQLNAPCVARPDLQPAVLVPHRDGGVRLDVALVDARRAELALDDHVGLLEALVDVALLELQCGPATLVGLSPFLPIASVRRSSWSSGASSFIASSTQVTLGSTSYSTLIFAGRFLGEMRLVAAATAATAWPR